MTPQERFALMLEAMTGTDELHEMIIDLEWQRANAAPANWGLDDDDKQQARADYADWYADLVN